VGSSLKVIVKASICHPLFPASGLKTFFNWRPCGLALDFWMSVKIKLAAYAVLLLLAAWFAWGFYSNYKTTTREAAETATNDTAAVVTNNPPDAGNNTNSSSNAVAAATNSAPATQTNIAAGTTASAPPARAAQGTMIAYLAAFVGAVIGLGLLVAHDVTQFLGNTAVDALLEDRGEGLRDPEYEKAEQAWANGKHLDAIQMMRDFLKKNPREQYAALRIAEIYEKDLNNPVAAALEYEEVLKKKLPAERWGWAAVHLCNLYSKLGQQDKTRALLQRIADEYPQTAAAKKARNRLGLPEPEAPAPVVAEGEELVAEPAGAITPPSAEEQPEAEPSEPPEPPPKSNLPPGFRPKK
jgi:TolA-binding protein